MSTPHNPNDPNSQPSANQPEGQSWGQQPADPYAAQQPWGQQSANQPEGQSWGQQATDPNAGQQSWGTQPQQPTDQWGGAQADPYAAGQYGQQQSWNGQAQASMIKNDGKNLFSALFDFSFSTFVTPKIIKIVYVILTALIGLGVVFTLIAGLVTGEPLAIIGALVLGPIVGIIYLALARMSLELYFAVVRLSEDVHERLPRQ